MKRQVDKTGGKLWFNENLIEGFQDQLYKAVESQYKPFGSCIISGCEVSGSNIAEGIVYLDSKIMPFAGASGVTFPKYLKSRVTPVTAAYDDGHSDTTEEIYEAILSSTIPSGDYITISAQGGKTFRQAFQDANNRMVSDSKINEWNGIEGRASSDATKKADDVAAASYPHKVSGYSGSLNDLPHGVQTLTGGCIDLPVGRHSQNGSVVATYRGCDIRVKIQELFLAEDQEIWHRSKTDVRDWSVWKQLETVFGATAKANTAKSEAVSAAASDATTKASTAKSEAIIAAASDATTKASTAKSEAIIAAASDATTKANTAKSEAVSASYPHKVLGYSGSLNDLPHGVQTLTGGCIDLPVGRHSQNGSVVATYRGYDIRVKIQELFLAEDQEIWHRSKTDVRDWSVWKLRGNAEGSSIIDFKAKTITTDDIIIR